MNEADRTAAAEALRIAATMGSRSAAASAVAQVLLGAVAHGEAPAVLERSLADTSTGDVLVTLRFPGLLASRVESDS